MVIVWQYVKRWCKYRNILFICNGKYYQNVSNCEQFVHIFQPTKVNAILSLQQLQNQLISQINKNTMLYLQHCIKNTEKCIFINVLFLQYRGVVSDNCRTSGSEVAWSTTILQPHQSPFPTPFNPPFSSPFPILYIPSIYSILLSSIFISSNYLILN